MTLFVKICGVTDDIAAETCVETGVDAVGFVFAESPRRIAPEDAARIAATLPARIAKVAVFRRPTADEVQRVLDVFAADFVQADHDTLPSLGGVEALPVYREGEDIAPGDTRFLFEGPLSGAGQTVDFAEAARLARRGGMILAGGLRPDNVAGAIKIVRPWGVDVSSGVEKDPALKSPALIRSFVAAARAAEERRVTT